MRDSADMRRRRWAVRTGVVGIGAVTAVLALAVPAWAHVKVSGIDAVQAGSGVVTFRVPSESATASTTELLLTFPSATPFTSVDTQPKAGWTATVSRKPLARPQQGEDGSVINQYVSQVDFKATSPASAIPPGQFDMFNLSVGPFPDAPSVAFGALQTYSDGTTVNWDEQSADGVTEPVHPAPVLQLSPAAAGTPAPDGRAAAAAPGSPGSSWMDDAALGLGIVALLLSGITLAVVRNRNRTSARS
ncbi:YcnI family protein [Pseudonocardia xinjiangensis]|uniref:YcnI family copper-binding membrane protein n=1 Tax=Pseudonocardia xinjiangensis TaxID=75289 RepID=UPI003D8D89BF